MIKFTIQQLCGAKSNPKTLSDCTSDTSVSNSACCMMQFSNSTSSFCSSVSYDIIRRITPELLLPTVTAVTQLQYKSINCATNVPFQTYSNDCSKMTTTPNGFSDCKDGNTSDSTCCFFQYNTNGVSSPVYNGCTMTQNNIIANTNSTTLIASKIAMYASLGITDNLVKVTNVVCSQTATLDAGSLFTTSILVLSSLLALIF